MYNGGCLWTARTEREHVCHYIMPSFLFLCSRQIVVDICQISFHFLDLFVWDIQTKHLIKFKEKKLKPKKMNNIVTGSKFIWMSFNPLRKKTSLEIFTFSDFARNSHSFLHVENFLSSEKLNAISGLAYRLVRGLR